MAIPHLLADKAACSYQGYLLALMAVYQTRAYFTGKFGYLTDNPEIGPLMAKHYWSKGNNINHNSTLLSLTGEGFNAKYLADTCNMTAEQAWELEQNKIAALSTRERAPAASLNTSITVVDGSMFLATNETSDRQMCVQFEQHIMADYAR